MWDIQKVLLGFLKYGIMRNKRVSPNILWAFTWVFYEDEKEEKILRKGGYSTAEAENRIQTQDLGNISDSG